MTAAEYYEQRSSAGLIITEGMLRRRTVWPRAFRALFPTRSRGLADAGCARRGAKIFPQPMHTGRVTHPLNQRTQKSSRRRPRQLRAMWIDQRHAEPLRRRRDTRLRA
jgi:2,4-dienoyl-CoA reductase-like NADH-dependent reductase (Old Yellow Enzyme family)